jgi:hypothetical protein
MTCAARSIRNSLLVLFFSRSKRTETSHSDSAAEIDSMAKPSPGGANQVVTPQR